MTLPTGLEMTVFDEVFRNRPHERFDALRAADPVHDDKVLGRVLLTRAHVDDYDLAKGPATLTPCTVDEGPDDPARVYAIGAERIRIDADVARVRTVSAVDIETPISREMERHPLFDAPNCWKVDFTNDRTAYPRLRGG
jgi:hypothetical protein